MQEPKRDTYKSTDKSPITPLYQQQELTDNTNQLREPQKVPDQIKAGIGRHPRNPPPIKPGRLDPDAPIKVRFLKDYRTQVARPGNPSAYDDRLYVVGEIAEIPNWKVKDLVSRGIAEAIA